ncbi:hypothetical protein FQA39_LY07364 [Lamprigera yunnana]|nr:hypothetical protein FQA39_LY07364 [Lamprigera yunnana]
MEITLNANKDKYVLLRRAYQVGNSESKWKSSRLRRNEKFDCINCGRCYARRNTLQRHLSYECGVEPQFACDVPGCKCVLSTNNSKEDMTKLLLYDWLLNRGDLKDKNADSKPKSSKLRKYGRFDCVNCGRYYARKDTLQRHLKYECGKDPQFEYVKRCFFGFGFKIKEEHFDGPGYPCENCGRVYKHRGNMRRHMAYECGEASQHEKKIQFKCLNCGRDYKYIQSLRLHMRLECGKDPKFFCNVGNCGYKSKRKGNLKHHLIMVHKVEPICAKNYIYEREES